MAIKSGAGVALAGVGFVLLVIAAGWLAGRLIRGNRAAVIGTYPILPDQTIAVPVSGELVVNVEVPRLNRDFQDWDVEVIAGNSQRSHRMKWSGSYSHGVVKGFTTIRIPFGRVTTAEAERLTVRISGLEAGKDYTGSHLVLVRPHLARIALQVVGLVFCGIGMLLCVIGGLWCLGIVKNVE